MIRLIELGYPQLDHWTLKLIRNLNHLPTLLSNMVAESIGGQASGAVARRRRVTLLVYIYTYIHIHKQGTTTHHNYLLRLSAHKFLSRSSNMVAEGIGRQASGAVACLC